MRFSLLIGVALFFAGQPAIAQEEVRLPNAPGIMDHPDQSAVVSGSVGATWPSPSIQVLQPQTELPLERLSEIANRGLGDEPGSTRSAKDAELYRTIAPSVVLIVTKDSLGSGSLVSARGDILTNWHVIKGATDVGVIFKPSVEGREPTKDDIKLAYIVRYDPVTDLALLKTAEPPKGRSPIRIGEGASISVGIDVHAIGHPKGESWTYTKGIISQYRLGFDWATDNIKHKADVIQTQTPINPGNSGGPLLDDNGILLGVNTFKTPGGEGLNFAVSADEVRKFVAQSAGSGQHTEAPKPTCEMKEIARFRNSENNASVISYDTRCVGKANAYYTVPDNKAEAITFTKDRNGDGRIDVIYFDFKHQKWDLSFWDEKFSGRWTLVGYHLDGSINPTEFESYETFQKRTASR